MSENTPFPPFNPNPSPPIAPEQPAAPKAKGRPKKTEKVVTGVTITNPGPFGQAETTVTTENRPRQKRKQSADKPSLKFDLQTILRAASGLNEDDMATFEKIVGLLSEAGKPGRERLLEAVAKIFA